MRKLTIAAIASGTVDLKNITVAAINEFCAEQKLTIIAPTGATKKDMLNLTIDALELRDQGPTEPEPEPEPETETETETAKYRENGELIRLAKDGNDYGSNWQNRQQK